MVRVWRFSTHTKDILAFCYHSTFSFPLIFRSRWQIKLAKLMAVLSAYDTSRVIIFGFTLQRCATLKSSVHAGRERERERGRQTDWWAGHYVVRYRSAPDQSILNQFWVAAYARTVLEGHVPADNLSTRWRAFSTHAQRATRYRWYTFSIRAESERYINWDSWSVNPSIHPFICITQQGLQNSTLKH